MIALGIGPDQAAAIGVDLWNALVGELNRKGRR
jgi:hypothetical protein